MARIRPFRGIRYDRDNLSTGDVGDVVAPPYDVIDEKEQDALYARAPENVVRLILNRGGAGDTAENDRYTRARRHLLDWIASGALDVDEKPALYFHVQEFDGPKGERVRRRGFLATVGLARYEENVVLPHERTLRGPKEDRLRLMKAVECNLSPIFLLYDDPDQAVDGALESACGDPVLDITTDDGIRHQLWVVDDPDCTAEVAGHLEDEQVLIADGHHRYETALAYRDFRRTVEEDEAEDPPYDYALAFLVNMHDPGLQVFPTHRVVHGVDDFDPQALIEKLDAHDAFRLQSLTTEPGGQAMLDSLEDAGVEAPSFVLVFPGEEAPASQLVSFVGGSETDLFDAETPEEVRALDVAILHEGILDRMLGISKEAQEAKANLRYMKKLDEAIAQLDEPDTQLLVLMNPTPVEQVDRVCRSGGKMPQKSTYFYPKILSGILINPL